MLLQIQCIQKFFAVFYFVCVRKNLTSAIKDMLTHKLRQCMEALQSASQIMFQITVDMVNDTSLEGDLYCTSEDLNVDSTTIKLLNYIQ